MGARFIYRMDDIIPDMDWEMFWKYINLFQESKVKPLLGIVPDNQDPNLVVGENNKNFWNVMRDLQSGRIVEVAQHGYRHRVIPVKTKGLQGREYGFNELTEFAGSSYELQYNKIKAGRDILRKQGIYTDVWMAPCHSFDLVTLEVLVDLGFRTVTDGIAIYPYKINDLIFVPQQLWQPRRLPFGVWTICLHINDRNEQLFRLVKKHILSGADIISFSEAAKTSTTVTSHVINHVFKVGYKFARLLKSRNNSAG